MVTKGRTVAWFAPSVTSAPIGRQQHEFARQDSGDEARTMKGDELVIDERKDASKITTGVVGTGLRRRSAPRSRALATRRTSSACTDDLKGF
jgi:hypothetical protein